MKIFKKTAAVALALALLLGLTACHPANEVALTVGGYEYTSAFYMCAFLQADGEAQSKVNEAYTDAGKDTTDIKYKKEKIDGKKYGDWVRERAVEIVTVYAYMEQQCDEKGVKLSDEEHTEAESYAEYYWNYYGYSSYYSANGVSYDTFKEYYLYGSLMQTYFLSIYGKDGTDAVPEEEIKTFMNDNFVLADALTVSLYDDQGQALTDEQVAEKKTALEGYKTRLDGGEEFKKIYEEENGEGSASSSAGGDDVPQDNLAQVFGSDKTESYESDYFDDIKAMALGESKIIDDSDNSTLLLVVKKDVLADPYYYNEMSESILNLMKYDDFEEDMKAAAGKMDVQRNNFAINRFTVGKIKEGE